ncbi:MAG: hypothetical protein ACRCT1_21980 [Microcoleaceae cyanobacterium]
MRNQYRPSLIDYTSVGMGDWGWGIGDGGWGIGELIIVNYQLLTFFVPSSFVPLCLCAFVVHSFSLLPSSFFLLPSSFFLLPSSFV